MLAEMLRLVRTDNHKDQLMHLYQRLYGESNYQYFGERTAEDLTDVKIDVIEGSDVRFQVNPQKLQEKNGATNHRAYCFLNSTNDNPADMFFEIFDYDYIHYGTYSISWPQDEYGNFFVEVNSTLFPSEGTKPYTWGEQTPAFFVPEDSPDVPNGIYVYLYKMSFPRDEFYSSEIGSKEWSLMIKQPDEWTEFDVIAKPEWTTSDNPYYTPKPDYMTGINIMPHGPVEAISNYRFDNKDYFNLQIYNGSNNLITAYREPNWHERVKGLYARTPTLGSTHTKTRNTENYNDSQWLWWYDWVGAEMKIRCYPKIID